MCISCVFFSCIKKKKKVFPGVHTLPQPTSGSEAPVPHGVHAVLCLIWIHYLDICENLRFSLYKYEYDCISHAILIGTTHLGVACDKPPSHPDSVTTAMWWGGLCHLPSLGPWMQTQYSILTFLFEANIPPVCFIFNFFKFSYFHCLKLRTLNLLFENPHLLASHPLKQPASPPACPLPQDPKAPLFCVHGSRAWTFNTVLRNVRHVGLPVLAQCQSLNILGSLIILLQQNRESWRFFCWIWRYRHR